MSREELRVYLIIGIISFCSGAASGVLVASLVLLCERFCTR